MRRLMCLFVLLAFCVPASLSASTKTYKKGFKIDSPVEVQNVMLAPGHYEVTWTRMGNNVPVTILRDGNPIVTVANASVVEQKNPEGGTYNVNTSGALETAKGPNGANMLTKIDFSNLAIVLAPGSATR
jgi:hypothetical protein